MSSERKLILFVSSLLNRYVISRQNMTCAAIRWFVILSLSGCAYCNTMKQIETQMHLLAGSQHLESLSRQKDTTKIMERLSFIETALNGSMENSRCSNSIQSGDNPIKPVVIPGNCINKNDFVRLMKAFQEEKVVTEGLRRQVPNMATKVNTFDKTVSNISNTVELIREEMCSTFEAATIMSDVESMRKEIDNMCRENKIIKAESDGSIGKINKIEKSLKKLSIKMDKLENIASTNKNGETLLNRLDKIENMLVTILSLTQKHESCLGHYKTGSTADGIYTVYPLKDDKPVQVYCDMTTDGGGWTVFQRRKDGSVDFFRNWQDYKQGFGDSGGEFWLGNEIIAALTRTCCHELRIELEDFDRDKKHAKYSKFQVLSETDNYKLVVDLYSGDANDSLTYHNNMYFTTKDRDHDLNDKCCAVIYKGAWWHNSCYRSSLNGLYLKVPLSRDSTGIHWIDWKGAQFSMKMTEMKLR